MSYLDTKPKFTHTTGCTFTQWAVMFDLFREFGDNLPSGLAGLSLLGSLDAVEVMPAGGMTSTPVWGSPIPLFVYREAKA